MALGKNIHLKKETESKKSGLKKSPSKGKIEKKKLISNKISKSKSLKIKENSSLAWYITEETQKRKVALRQRYLKELAEAKDNLMQFIIIKIGSDQFAIDIDLVKEVVPFSSIAKIPNTPKHIIGATIVRGKTITAIDLESKFNQVPNNDYQFTVSLKNKKHRVGLVVHHLPVALKVGGEKIDGNLKSLQASIDDETYIKGVIKHENTLIFYLDIDELINGDEAIVVPDQIAYSK